MNKTELVEIVAKEADLSKAAAASALDAVIAAIVTAVSKGDTASLIGFGTFKPSKRASPHQGAILRPARNSRLQLPRCLVSQRVLVSRLPWLERKWRRKSSLLLPSRAIRGRCILCRCRLNECWNQYGGVYEEIQTSGGLPLGQESRRMTASRSGELTCQLIFLLSVSSMSVERYPLHACNVCLATRSYLDEQGIRVTQLTLVAHKFSTIDVAVNATR
jgi:hypothetical protein